MQFIVHAIPSHTFNENGKQNFHRVRAIETTPPRNHHPPRAEMRSTVKIILERFRAQNVKSRLMLPAVKPSRRFETKSREERRGRGEWKRRSMIHKNCLDIAAIHTLACIERGESLLLLLCILFPRPPSLLLHPFSRAPF